LERIKAERLKGKVSVVRFKGLGEMSPLQLRETTMNPDTRRLVQLTLPEEGPEAVDRLMDKLLARKRAEARRRPPRLAGRQGQPGPDRPVRIP